MKTKIESQISLKSCILGTYSGECADANITNNNGLDITREVWDEVFKSEEYKVLRMAGSLDILATQIHRII